MQEMSYFYLLKDELLQKYQQAHPAWTGAIHDFKTREIANFQGLLEKTVGSRISEKWFYTHIKPIENKKLPRIDTLDMLSVFIGYKDWEAFVEQQYEHQQKAPAVTDLVKPVGTKKGPWLIGGFFALVFLLGLVLLQKEPTYTICFVDADMGKAVKGSIEVQVFKDNESPVIRRTDKDACIRFEGSDASIRFAVSAPYYKSDTITRLMDQKDNREVIKLRKDDFALMIHLFSNNNLKDWKKRRKQLDKMIADDAVIFQINENKLGLEMYNKPEFINKLTMPINSLKNIRIVDTQYREGKILEMRFIQEGADVE